jgi:hypothetical protein
VTRFQRRQLIKEIGRKTLTGSVLKVLNSSLTVAETVQLVVIVDYALPGALPATRGHKERVLEHHLDLVAQI